MRFAQTFQNKPTDHVLKLQATFLYSSINEQVKLISFIWEGVEFTFLILDVPLKQKWHHYHYSPIINGQWSLDWNELGSLDTALIDS